MKKTFTILFAVGIALSAAAQPAYQSNSAFNKNKHETMYAHPAHLPVMDKSNGFNLSSFSYKDKERQLKEINWRFDREIALVKRNRYMGWKEKSVQIHIMENQRSSEIRRVQYAYERNSHRLVDDGYSRNNTHKW